MASPIRRVAARNREAADLAAFKALLVEALADPDVQRAIAAAVRRAEVRRGARNRPAADAQVVGAAGARQLKDRRLAARGRGSRG